MSNLFRNNYKVYLYKYNFSKLKDDITDILKQGVPYNFLFESFVTDLYTLGMPTDWVKEQYEKYKEEFNSYKQKFNSTLSNLSKEALKRSDNTEYKTIQNRYDELKSVQYYRASISSSEELLQDALAQNWALQQLQKTYEDSQTGDDIKLNWLHTKDEKQNYDNYINQALDKSNQLLKSMFDKVIDEIKSIQEGNLNSKYVYVIELTDLSTFNGIEEVITDRTKYSSDTVMTANTSRRVVSNDFSTDAVSNIGAINTSLSNMTNRTNLNLRQDILLKYKINIEANDIIEIVSINHNKNIDEDYKVIDDNPRRNTQFIGFVTKISLNNRYETVSDLSVTCEGISKVLSMNPTISDNAISPQFASVVDFIAGVDKTQELSDSSTVNALSTYFDGKNANDLFISLIGDILGASILEGDIKNYSLRLVSDLERLKKLPYQYAKPLIVLYHYAISYSTVRELGKKPTQIVIARVENNVLQSRLQAYLLMIRAHYDMFWSQSITPIQILRTLAENTFLEIYEERCGILVLRPPRYNTWIYKDVIKEERFIEWSQQINDSELKSRSDYKWSINAIGVQNEFPGGYYQDIPSLLKYGFRIDSPKNSPSVQSEIEAQVFSSLDVTKSNSETRTLELTVPMIQDYEIGKLYYFPINNLNINSVISTGFVGYLTDITSTIAPGHVDQHKLIFKYMRTADLIDSGLLDNGGYILNFKRLPDLEIFMNLIKEDDIPKDAIVNLIRNKKQGSTPAQNRYYWASFNKSNKTNFDTWIEDGTYVDSNSINNLYTTMAPTLLHPGSFQTLDEIKSSEFMPTQQLINAIWFNDTTNRLNIDKSNYNQSYEKSKILCTRDNEDDFYTLISKDKTLGPDIINAKTNNVFNYLDESLGIKYEGDINKLNKLNGSYAAIKDSFIINTSLIPNARTYGYEQYNIIQTYMNRIKILYTNISTDGNSDYAYRVWINNNIKKEIKENSNGVFSSIANFFRSIVNNAKPKLDISSSEFTKKYNEHVNNLKTVLDKYAESCNNQYLIGSFLSEYTKYISDIEIATKYIQEKDKNWFEKFVDLINKMSFSALSAYNPATIPIKKLVSYIGTCFSSTTDKKYSNMCIPAYALYNTDSKEYPNVNGVYFSNFPRLNTFGNAMYGGYITGISPVDYNKFLKNLKNNNFFNGNIPLFSLENNKLLNCKNETVGTITKLIPVKGSKTCFLPVVTFNSESVKNIYNCSVEDITNNYIFTEDDITAFNNGSTNKYLGSLIIVDIIQIPESKIPTIQQIELNGGLYVGVKSEDGKNVEDEHTAIFDISKLYEWNTSNLKNTFGATIYNFIYKSQDDKFLNTCISTNTNSWRGSYTWKELFYQTDNIKNKQIYFDRCPCVYTTNLNFGNLKTHKFIVDNETKQKIRECFNTDNKGISKVNKSSRLNLNTASSLYKTGNISDLNINMNFDSNDDVYYIQDIDVNGDAMYIDYRGVRVNKNNGVSASVNETVSQEIKSTLTKDSKNVFKTLLYNSAVDRENTNIAIYTNNVPYATIETCKDLYPDSFDCRTTVAGGMLEGILQITVKRYIFEGDPVHGGRTIGKMYINGIYFCDTLEDFDRKLTQKNTPEEVMKIKEKGYGDTAIPTGSYAVKIERFKRLNNDYYPLLYDVNGFTGIFIHTGAGIANTEGCILVGDYDEITGNWKLNSKYPSQIVDKMKKYPKTTISVM